MSYKQMGTFRAGYHCPECGHWGVVDVTVIDPDHDDSHCPECGCTNVDLVDLTYKSSSSITIRILKEHLDKQNPTKGWSRAFGVR